MSSLEEKDNDVATQYKTILEEKNREIAAAKEEVEAQKNKGFFFRLFGRK
ncbi:hypothetical protein QUF84_13185 [Fictibacillus enclensis]|nr:hypothetical protein [Fictibacillus enclensis]MDM5338175.1 hypothetical protein [Fictibacillus enclensis]